MHPGSPPTCCARRGSDGLLPARDASGNELRRRAGGLHDLGRRRTRRDAPADAAHVRDARADRAEALAEKHPPLQPPRRRTAPPDPGDDRPGTEPGRGRDGAGAGRAGGATEGESERAGRKERGLMQPDKFTQKSQKAIAATLERARGPRNPEATPAHLLVSLLEETEGLTVPILQRVGADTATIAPRAAEAGAALPQR